MAKQCAAAPRHEGRGWQSLRLVGRVAELTSLKLGGACIAMSIKRKKAIGWSLLGVGICIAVFSHKIVFPGLESLLGIERIVGRQNVVYLADVGYAYTNPGAMVRWITAVVMVGLVLTAIGGILVFRTRSLRLS